MGRVTFSPLVEQIRESIKTQSRAEDVILLVAWLLTHYTDDGHLRSPQAARRKTIALDGVTYWLVRRPPA